jgi:hypothetical protein
MAKYYPVDAGQLLLGPLNEFLAEKRARTERESTRERAYQEQATEREERRRQHEEMISHRERMSRATERGRAFSMEADRGAAYLEDQNRRQGQRPAQPMTPPPMAAPPMAAPPMATVSPPVSRARQLRTLGALPPLSEADKLIEGTFERHRTPEIMGLMEPPKAAAAPAPTAAPPAYPAPQPGAGPAQPGVAALREPGVEALRELGERRRSREEEMVAVDRAEKRARGLEKFMPWGADAIRKNPTGPGPTGKQIRDAFNGYLLKQRLLARAGRPVTAASRGDAAKVQQLSLSVKKGNIDGAARALMGLNPGMDKVDAADEATVMVATHKEDQRRKEQLQVSREAGTIWRAAQAQYTKRVQDISAGRGQRRDKDRATHEATKTLRQAKHTYMAQLAASKGKPFHEHEISDPIGKQLVKILWDRSTSGGGITNPEALLRRIELEDDFYRLNTETMQSIRLALNEDLTPEERDTAIQALYTQSSGPPSRMWE